MRIAHVVTYISPDAAFGGPVRVALSQAAELAARGHDVTVYAGAPPALAKSAVDGGFTLRTFPARRIAPFGGFAALAAPALRRALADDLSEIDVVHVHMARDLVTIPAALTARARQAPYVLQPHGMIDASANPLAGPLDVIATKRLLRDANAVLTLTEQEARDISEIERGARTKAIRNGIHFDQQASYEARTDTVLFLARLASRKRPVAFVEMAIQLRDVLPRTRFILAGPDEGEGPAVRAVIAASGMGDRIEWIGPVNPSETDALIASARAYVLPAFNEVFPMSVLEAFRAGTPVVTTSSLGIADAALKHSAAIITDGSASELARGVLDVMTDDAVPSTLRAGAERYLRAELGIEAVAVDLENVYAECLDRQGTGRGKR